MAECERVAPDDAGGPSATVVLRDYPLRLWARQTQHNEELLREFRLLTESERAKPGSAPADLVHLAEEIIGKFANAIEALDDERRKAFNTGLDRMDFTFPLPPAAVPLVKSAMDVLRRADEYCAEARLLALPRPPELVAFSDWTLREIVAQHEGAEPKPWPGPF
jgi:hypothetical protein